MASQAIEVIFRGNATSAVAAARQAERAIGGVSATAGRSSSALSRVGSALGRSMKLAGVAMAGFAATAGGAIAMTGLKFAAMKEQAEIAFTTMLGSGAKAREFLAELEAFANKTPFEFPDLLGASQRLLAMGFAARDVIPMMTTVGDTVAALGGGSAEIDRVVRALGQMQAKGKVSAEEMMQLTEIGIPAWQMLARTLGVDVATAMEMVSKRQVDAGKAIDGMLAQMRSKYGGMMEEQSKTLAGLWSTTKDLFRSISAKLIGPLLPMLKQALDWVNRFISGFDVSRIFDFAGGATGALGGLVDGLRGVWESARSAISGLAGSLWQGIQPVLSSIAGVVQNVLMPIFSRVAGIVGDAFGAIARTIRDHEPQIRSIGESLGRAFSAIGTVIQNVARVALPVLRVVFVEVLPRAIGAAITVLDRLIGVVADVVSWFAGLHGKIAGAIAGLPGAIKGIVDRVVSFFAQLPARVMGFFAQLASKLAGWVQTGTSKAAAIGRGIVTGIGNALGKLVERVKSAFRQVWNWATTAAGTAKAWFFKVGSGIVSGIVNGLGGLFSAVYSKIKGALSDAIDAVKGWLGIGSPSRLMAEQVGRPIMEGVADGISAGTSRARRQMEESIDALIAAARRRIRGRGNPATAAGGSVIDAIIREAKSQLGKPYIWGSAAGRSYFGPNPRGFDCSGFVSWLLKQATGKFYSAFTGELVKQGRAVPRGAQRAGDLVFFGNPESPRGGHVGMMLDQNRFIHASSAGGVKISDLRTYGREAVAFRRVLDGLPAAMSRVGAAGGRMGGALARAIEQAIRRVERLRDKLRQAYQTFQSMALEAFDRLTEAYQTPAEAQLAAMEEAREAQELAERKAAAQQALRNAKTAEERAEAQRELNDILYEEQRRALEKQAELERREYEDQRAQERAQFERDLAKLQEHLARKKHTAQQALKEMRELLDKYGIDMSSVGGIIGQSFTLGLANSMDAVATFADEIAKAIRKLKKAAAGGGGGGGGSAGGGGSGGGSAGGGGGGGGGSGGGGGAASSSGASSGPKWNDPKWSVQNHDIPEGTFPWWGYIFGRVIGRGKPVFVQGARAHGLGAAWVDGQFKEAHPKEWKMLAKGGIITGPTVGLLGEAGREAVLPLDSPTFWVRLREALLARGIPASVVERILDALRRQPRPRRLRHGDLVPLTYPLPGRGGAAGGRTDERWIGPARDYTIVQNIYVSGSVIAERDLAQTARAGLARIKTRTATLGLD